MLFDVFVATALNLYFVNGSPIITGDNIYVEIGINKPGSHVECHLTRLANSRKDCMLQIPFTK